MTIATASNDCIHEVCKNSRKEKENPSHLTCVNTNSSFQDRRIAYQDPALGGLFNYIPKECPHYKKYRKCRLGDKCFRAHGQIEIIFHPLLYKTKLCQSSLENGVCAKFGVYCAKAHKRSELRNLVQIYGANWKVHYDMSKRAIYSNKKGNYPVKITNCESRLCHLQEKSAEDDCMIPTCRQKEFMNVVMHEINDYICETNSQCGDSPSSTASEQFSKYRCQFGKKEVNDYTELYGLEVAAEKSHSDEVMSDESGHSVCEFSSFNFSPLGTSKEEYCSDDASNSFSYFSNQIDTNDESLDSPCNKKACER